MLKFIKILFLLSLTAVDLAYGQIETARGPLSDYKIESWFELKLDEQVLKELAMVIQPKDVSFQFAIPVPVNLNPLNSGKVFNTGKETVWILGIRSREAKSLNLILEPFRLPPGAYVYIYDSAKKTVRGAFTSENNSASSVLATMPVPGGELILEYHIPSGLQWENSLGVSQISHDYLGVFGYDDKKDNRYKLSQACNIDINCPDGNQLSTEKRSVCRLIVRGSELCSGVLLNNTNHENRPFLLTAQHCIADQNDADKTIFVFGYESPWCNGPDGRVSHSLSGSVLRSTNQTIDFTLVELNTFPPLVYKPYLAGWDVSGAVPAYSASIHHPMGDVKKLAKDLDPPVTGTFNTMIANSFWKILQWDGGTTEGGSSGAPLFDQNKRVVGILTGGEAVCGRSVNDYFAKLSVIYNLSSILWEQLKGWIDPAVSGIKQLSGRDPYAPNLLANDTLSNFTSGEVPVLTRYSLPGQGYATGFNSDSLVMYAEYFTNTAAHEICEVWMNIARANAVGPADSIRIYVMADGAVPGNIIASQKVFIREAKDSFRLKLDFNNTIPVSGNFYIGWRLFYSDKALLETRQFAVYHSPDRVLANKNTAWFNDGNGWKQFIQHPFLPMSVSLDVRVITTTNPVVSNIPETKPGGSNFMVYPNPAADKIVISSKNIMPVVSLRILDISGKILQMKPITKSFPGELIIDISQLANGFYLFNFFSEGSSETHKILINR